LNASLLDTSTLQVTAQVLDSNTCTATSEGTVIWAQDLATGTNQASDHTGFGGAQNAIVIPTVGDSACVKFTTSDSTSYEKLSVTYFYE
jgi:hypothetical protein